LLSSVRVPVLPFQVIQQRERRHEPAQNACHLILPQNPQATLQSRSIIATFHLICHPRVILALPNDEFAFLARTRNNLFVDGRPGKLHGGRTPGLASTDQVRPPHFRVSWTMSCQMVPLICHQLSATSPSRNSSATSFSLTRNLGARSVFSEARPSDTASQI
jgi:hypothetical protein